MYSLGTQRVGKTPGNDCLQLTSTFLQVGRGSHTCPPLGQGVECCHLNLGHECSCMLPTSAPTPPTPGNQAAEHVSIAQQQISRHSQLPSQSAQAIWRLHQPQEKIQTDRKVEDSVGILPCLKERRDLLSGKAHFCVRKIIHQANPRGTQSIACGTFSAGVCSPLYNAFGIAVTHVIIQTRMQMARWLVVCR